MSLSFALTLALAASAPLPPYLIPDEVNTIRVFRGASPAVVNISNVQIERFMFSDAEDAVAALEAAGEGRDHVPRRVRAGVC